MVKDEGEGVKSRWEWKRKKKVLEFQQGTVPKGSSGQMSESHTQQSRAVGQLGAECELQ